MKTPIWVYIAVVILSAGAGLAIAGIPDTSPREPTIIPPSTTEAPDPLEQAAALVEEAAAEEEAAALETTVAATTTVVETTTTTTTTTVPLPERAELEITVANGADIGGIAGRTVTLLGELGYPQAVARDGTDIVGQTIIYAPDELVAFAERLSDDLGLPGGRIQPIDRAPAGESTVDAVVILYLGSDIEAILS